MMPDGRRWATQNLNIPFLGWKHPRAPKEEGRLYKFIHVQIINTMLCLFRVGWHVPTDDEWQLLIDAADGEDEAGNKLKAKEGWTDDGNGTDDFGFRVLPAGYRNATGSGFVYRGFYAYFWSSSAYSASHAWYRRFGYSYARVNRNNTSRSFGYSVRLIKNK
jgi:uncharacterized protein (TIGR02145 family)